jgi:hypothetical protein
LDSLCFDYGDSNPDSAVFFGNKAIAGCIKEKGKNSEEYAVCLDHIAWAYKNKYQLVSCGLLSEDIPATRMLPNKHITWSFKPKV